MERFNEKQTEESPKLFFRNHILGMIMNNLSCNFNSDGCVKGSINSSCALFCLHPWRFKMNIFLSQFKFNKVCPFQSV